MPYLGKQPAQAALTASDITDGIITTAKIQDTAITNAKLAQDIISAETELAVAPADTDELLISDAGTLKRIDASLIGGGGITVADQYRVTANITANDVISSNDNVSMTIEVTTNNSSYNSAASCSDSATSGSNKNFGMYCQTLIDVTDVSNVKVRFQTGSLASGNFFSGSTDTNLTYMTFIRLGDT